MGAAELNVQAGQKGFIRLPLEARFWAKVALSPGCWTWTGSKTPLGYGQFWVEGKLRFAHRVSYELARGPVPQGLVLDHLCRCPSCVNPAHLEAVTQRENMRRGKRGLNQHARKTHCIRGHELAGDNLLRGPKRRCRTCHQMRDRGYRAALSQALGEGQ